MFIVVIVWGYDGLYCIQKPVVRSEYRVAYLWEVVVAFAECVWDACVGCGWTRPVLVGGGGGCDVESLLRKYHRFLAPALLRGVCVGVGGECCRRSSGI